MTRTQRIVLFLLSTALLLLVFELTTGRAFPTSDQSIVLFSALLMMSFVTSFIEEFFTVPSDVLSSNIAILLLIAPLHSQLSRFGVWYWRFFFYNLLLLLCSLAALLLLSSEKSPGCLQNRVSKHLKRVATFFGNGRFLYCVLFLLTLLFYVDSQSYEFFALSCYAALIILVDPKRYIIAALRPSKSRDLAVGEIIGVHSKNIFLAKLYTQCSVPIHSFDLVQFCHQMDENRQACRGIVVDDYILNQQRWIKILATGEIQGALNGEPNDEPGQQNVVYKFSPSKRPDLLARFVGVVIERSDIAKIRFDFAGCAPVSEGSLVELAIEEKKVLYQVVQGITEVEALEGKDETGLRVGEALQLGIWDPKSFSFEKFGWVPEVNTPIFLSADIDDSELSAQDVTIGTIPGTNYPVLLNLQDAVTHHTAILGVTGSGKSVFCRDLIRKIAATGMKVICVDFTNEYRGKFSDLSPENIVPDQTRKEINEALEKLTSELDKFANQQSKPLIDSQSAILLEKCSKCVRDFLVSNSPMALFDLPDISNTTGILEYTKWFFRGVFKIAREENNLGKQVCIVIEEAHTVIPEWNFIGAEEKKATAVVNSISQIALQGRKYNVGFVVVAQRTANVSKTVLTQCNSVIAFQQFDKTSTDFLTNYMGSEMAAALPSLRFRQAVAVGKAFRSRVPMIFEVPEILEPDAETAAEAPGEPAPDRDQINYEF
ncbi:MAG: ATP-binding protein [Terracidiphilus sp.]